MSRLSILALAALLAALPASAWELPKKLNLNKIIETAKDVKAAVGTPEEEEERAMGQDFAATLLGASPLLDNADVQKYVNRVGLYVALQGTRPNLAWRFGVIDNPNVNAFATPGGYVFITRGLLERLNSEAELAGALAHLIALVQRNHLLKSF
jgi:predicted Zn-dependent protease